MANENKTPSNFCKSSKFVKSQKGLLNLKMKANKAKENADYYIKSLDDIANQMNNNPKKLQEIQAEKKKIMQTKSDIEMDLSILNDVEDTLLSVCNKPQSKRHSKREK